MVVHGESGVGKSWLADSVPGPRLILDAEGGSRFTPSQPKVMWDPSMTPPVNDGTWDTTLCFVRNFETLQRVFQWLNSGQHPWKSVSLDSLTEIQKRCMDSVVGTSAPRQQDWGTLLQEMETLVRQFRDLTMHPTNPLEAVVFITTTRADQRGIVRPHLQGQLGLTLPYFVDVVGYLYTQVSAGGDLERQLLVQAYPGFLAKDRTGRLPAVVSNPNVQEMMEVIYGTTNVG